MKLKKDLITLLLPILVILILVIIKSFDKNSFELSAKAVHKISLEKKHIFSLSDYKSKLSSRENFNLIDLRSAKDYETGHLEGALNVQIENILENTDIEKNKSGASYVFYSENIAKAVKVWTLLSQKGYKNIYILDITKEFIPGNLFKSDSFPSANEELKYTFQPDTANRLE